MIKFSKTRIYKISEFKDSNVVYVESENMKNAITVWRKTQKMSQEKEPYSIEYATERIYY